DHLELIAYTFKEYYDSTFIYNYNDSICIHWHDSAGAGFDLIKYFDLYPIFTQTPLSPFAFMELYNLTLKFDSMLIYEYIDSIDYYSNKPTIKEIMDIYPNNNIQYHSKGHFNNIIYEEDQVRDYIYDSNNRLVETIDWVDNGVGFDLIGKDSFGYDNNNNLIYFGRLNFLGGNSFIATSATVHTYTNTGLLTSTANLNYFSSSLTSDTIDITNYGYDINDNLSIETFRNDIGDGLLYK